MNPADESSTHRLFAAIVLMGTGLTLACGGVAEGERQVDTGKGNGGGGSSSASGGAGSGTIALGSSSGTGTSTGSSGSSGSGGSGGVAPSPPNCPAQQWSCTTHYCGLAGDGWAVPDDCVCDATRPKQASDCATGQVFLCRNGTSTVDGRLLTETVPFECACAEKASGLCYQQCGDAYQLDDPFCQASDDGTSAACGCAIVFLK